jgi:hypothetical protein
MASGTWSHPRWRRGRGERYRRHRSRRCWRWRRAAGATTKHTNPGQHTAQASMASNASEGSSLLECNINISTAAAARCIRAAHSTGWAVLGSRTSSGPILCAMCLPTLCKVTHNVSVALFTHAWTPTPINMVAGVQAHSKTLLLPSLQTRRRSSPPPCRSGRSPAAAAVHSKLADCGCAGSTNKSTHRHSTMLY